MTLQNEKQKFLDELNRLETKFKKAEMAEESATKISSDLVELILWRERMRRGVSDRHHLWPEVDAETLARMAAWDTSDPQHVLTEKVLRRLAEGSGEGAVNLLKAAIDSRRQEFSKVQSSRAKAERTKGPLVTIIQQLVQENPAIDGNTLLTRLKRLCGQGVLSHIDAVEIHFEDPNTKSVKLTGLKDKLSRAKKKIRNSRASAN
jgi:hypothetical protein